MRAVATFPKAALGTVTNTILQLYAANSSRPLRVTEIGISFFGTSTTDEPIEVTLVRQTTAGTDGTAVTPVSVDDDDPHSIEATVLRKPTSADWTDEPTETDVLRRWSVHPQGSLVFPVPDPSLFVATGGTRLALKVTAPGAAVSATAYLEFEE